MDMHESIKAYGYTSPTQIDEDMRDLCRYLRPLRYPVGLAHVTTIRPEVQYAMMQAVAEMDDLEIIAETIMRKYGWCIKSWVRIQMFYMVIRWPKQYMKETKKIIVDYNRFWQDAWAADNIEELYETDY